MSFTGKASYSAGSTLPELAEDVSDIIGIVSPFETPLLDHLGDPRRPATSTIHEWIEDELLPNTDAINDSTYTDASADTAFVVDTASRFRVGDQIQVVGSREVMLVTAINSGTNTLTVVRGYGGTTAAALANDQVIRILGNAALEGDDRPATRFTNRTRRQNYTQIFTAGVEVSGSQLAARQIAVADELDYQKQERLRELLRDLENCVINGVAPGASPEGSATVRRTMRGIIPSISTNLFVNNSGGFPAGDGGGTNQLNEAQVNTALRQIWEQSAAQIDTIVVNGYQKRRINSFITSNRQFAADDESFKSLVSVYESDFGVCRVVLSRWVPADTVLLLDSSRLDVLPLSGRNFHFKKLASAGDSEVGQVIGEYTLEMRNPNAHGLIRGLATS
ncbi:MAG: DUF5309 domain-containing protein [Planctomycetes bacterium]|nr:DUF5309 domain-containing protein [Planctomycetota bacterium]